MTSTTLKLKESRSPDEAFVNVWLDHGADKDAFYGRWTEHSSGKNANNPLVGYKALRELYPKHSIVTTRDIRLNVLDFPGVSPEPLEDAPLFTSTMFLPLSTSASPIPGVLVDGVEFGAFKLTWQNKDFIAYIVIYPISLARLRHTYILHEGSEDDIRSLLLSVGLWAEKLHNEIWVFNQGYWQKDAALWRDVQKASWTDVILKEEFKKALKKDVYGFFDSERIYKDLGIPWKRGLILHGPPGNGKTISIKTIIKDCYALGFAPLYVKSFKSYMGEEGSMAAVFGKARQMAPCVIILEDLDSLINDENRSFFLNQVDGLQGNDGLLIVGTTNHFDRLDPGLSTRPSRFDRKYLFDDPDHGERELYAKYWQDKLKDKKDLDFPDSLVTSVADQTDRFSFAYLKEAFVSSLVTLAGIEGDKPSFKSVLDGQIKELRKQLNDDSAAAAPQADPVPPLHDVRGLVDALNASLSTSRGYAAPDPHYRPAMDQMPSDIFTDIISSSSRMLDHITGRRRGGMSLGPL